MPLWDKVNVQYTQRITHADMMRCANNDATLSSSIIFIILCHTSSSNDMNLQAYLTDRMGRTCFSSLTSNKAMFLPSYCSTSRAELMNGRDSL